MSIIVRLAEECDSREIFEWRNDEHTRQMFHSSEKVEWSRHTKWFEATLNNDKRLLLIAAISESESKIKVGVVRFDIEEDGVAVSINISPLMRGKGMAKECLAKALQYFSKLYPNQKNIEAEIKSVNVASQKIFEGVGFVSLNENEVDGVRHYQLLL